VTFHIQLHIIVHEKTKINYEYNEAYSSSSTHTHPEIVVTEIFEARDEDLLEEFVVERHNVGRKVAHKADASKLPFKLSNGHFLFEGCSNFKKVR
jgi:hypothetical protein